MAKTRGVPDELRAALLALLGLDTLSDVRSIRIDITGHSAPLIRVDLWGDAQQITDLVVAVADGPHDIVREHHQALLNMKEAADETAGSEVHAGEGGTIRDAGAGGPRGAQTGPADAVPDRHAETAG